MLMFLCWGGFRALLQFSLLSLTFGLLSMTLARENPPMERNLPRGRAAEAADVHPVFSVGAVRTTLPNTCGVDVNGRGLALRCIA